MSTTAGDDEQQKRMADDEGSNEEGGEGNGNGDVTRVTGERRQRW